MDVSIYIDLQRVTVPVPNDLHAEEMVQITEVIDLVVRLDAIDDGFDSSIAATGDYTVVNVRENVDRMAILIWEQCFYFLIFAPLFLVLMAGLMVAAFSSISVMGAGAGGC